ncbi:coiled-coil domain-containing protein 113 isoform X2 [Hippocampus zosterae]|uniref:coiled-coil domain-containing protein 113 isoform X2 n=1 Tax=Hippocampus zosterae TaxID=109293 RepID=UPI00223E1A4D|nr:coiled-coil domain-containing protein 113 isoform X2 [Hippocampus zosterae]
MQTNCEALDNQRVPVADIGDSYQPLQFLNTFNSSLYWPGTVTCIGTRPSVIVVIVNTKVCATALVLVLITFPHDATTSHLYSCVYVLSCQGQCRRQTSEANLHDGLWQLTLIQKMYVAQREVAEMIRNQQKDKQRSERILATYKASFKEIELQRADISKDKNDFEHRFLKPMKMSEINEPEKVLYYIRSKSTQCDKLKLKIQGLKAREKRLHLQLQEKRELRKAGLEDIFLEDSEPTIDLEELQVKRLQAQRSLNSHKEKLQHVTQECAQLSSDIMRMKEKLEKIEEDIFHAEEERSKAEAQNKQLRRQMSTYQAPDVAQYLQVKDKHKMLQQSVHTWQRKMTSKSKFWSQNRDSSVNSADAGAANGECPNPVTLPYIKQHGKA